MKHAILSHGIHSSYGKTLHKTLKSASKFVKKNKDIIVSVIRYDALDKGYIVTIYYSYLKDAED